MEYLLAFHAGADLLLDLGLCRGEVAEEDRAGIVLGLEEARDEEGCPGAQDGRMGLDLVEPAHEPPGAGRGLLDASPEPDEVVADGQLEDAVAGFGEAELWPAAARLDMSDQ